MSSKLPKQREQRQMESFFRLPVGEIRGEIIVLVQVKLKRCITAENKKNPVFESTCIRHNSLITIEKKPSFFYKSWFKAGVENVKDLLDEASRFISFDDFVRKFLSTLKLYLP